MPPSRELVRLGGQRRLEQQTLAAGLVAILRRLWRRIDPLDILASWVVLVDELLTAVTAAQLQAAGTAQPYVTAALAAQGAAPDPAGVVQPARFAGVAADGRPLDTLLTVPAGRSAALVDDGMPAAQALQVGRTGAERMLVTEVTDAGRAATGVAQVNDRSVRGYVRMATPPSCARCLILSGQWYETNRGFDRHPADDCVHLPAAEVIQPDDPRELFEDLPEAEQDRIFTRVGAQAIRDGADIFQVVNARRGMSTAGVFGRQALVTTEGTTRRGFAGRRLGEQGGFRRIPGERYRRAIPVRLMPEQILADAARLGYDREQTIRLLRLHGFIH